jgi:hypothetical protein
MNTRLLAALVAASLLASCGVDSTPRSSGASGASAPSSASPAPAAAQEEKSSEPKAEADKAGEGEKKPQ